MRTHETPCNTMAVSSDESLLRIKSPQLYRLSYQPEVLESLENHVPARAHPRGIVPAVCPCPHLATVPRVPALRFIGRTVVAAYLLNGES
jgi:hypothetical protein